MIRSFSTPKCQLPLTNQIGFQLTSPATMGTSAMCDSPFPRSRGGVGGDLNPGRALELEKIWKPRAIALFPKNLPTPTSASRCWPRIWAQVLPMCPRHVAQEPLAGPLGQRGPAHGWPPRQSPHPVPFIPCIQEPRCRSSRGSLDPLARPIGKSKPSGLWGLERYGEQGQRQNMAVPA